MRIGSRKLRARDGTGGMTIIELLFSFGALLVVMLGFSRMLISSRMASTTTHEATLAKEAARAMIETLEATRFSAIYATYNSDPGDGGVTPVADFEAGKGFKVRGAQGHGDALEPPVGFERPGQILFPESGGKLSELVTAPQYGWTGLDLNGDGDSDDADVSSDYKYLPVVVRVSWSSSGGVGSVEFKTIIANF